MLTVFQVRVDLEESQTLTASSDLDARLFDVPKTGESVKNRPWPERFEVFDPESPRANFFSFDRTFLTMDEFARSCFGRLLDDLGEVLAFPLGAKETVYLFNPLTVLGESAVDWTLTRERLGVYSNLTLKKEMVPSNSVFRIPKIRGLFCSSELKDEHADFFTIYNKHSLTGLKFYRLWDEYAGAVPKRTTADP